MDSIQTILNNIVVDSHKAEEYEKMIKNQTMKEEKASLEYNFKHISGVPKRYLQESLGTWECSSEGDIVNLRTIQHFVETKNQNKILALLGNYGTGKTHLGCSIIREMGGLYITSQKLCIEYESGSDFKAEANKMQILRKYSTAPMLIIDEVGRGFKPDLEKEIISFIISERYANDLPMGIISNFKKDGFVRFIGDAMYDRFSEVGIILEFLGRSKRFDKRVS